MAQVVEQIGGAVHRVQDPNWAGEVHAGVVLLLPMNWTSGARAARWRFSWSCTAVSTAVTKSVGPLCGGPGTPAPGGRRALSLTDGGTELIEQQIGQLEHRKAPIDVMPLRRAERSDWRIPPSDGEISTGRGGKKRGVACRLLLLPPPTYNNQYNQSSAPKSAFASLRRSGQREERASGPI